MKDLRDLKDFDTAKEKEGHLALGVRQTGEAHALATGVGCSAVPLSCACSQKHLSHTHILNTHTLDLGSGEQAKRLRCAEFQRFLMVLSVRPGSRFAISTQLLPSSLCACALPVASEHFRV